MCEYLGPYHAFGRPRQNSGLPALTFHRPGCCAPVGSELSDIPLSSSSSPYLSQLPLFSHPSFYHFVKQNLQKEILKTIQKQLCRALELVPISNLHLEPYFQTQMCCRTVSMVQKYLPNSEPQNKAQHLLSWLPGREGQNSANSRSVFASNFRSESCSFVESLKSIMSHIFL